MIDKDRRLVNPDGQMLRSLRKTLNMSQPKFAKEFGVTRDTINRYEMGLRQVRLSLEQFLTLLRLLQKAKESGNSLGPDISQYLDEIIERTEQMVERIDD
ncbi:helix-turn-helix domain-containing protein [Limnofasciculus baicalensis]|nr:helix-turn-helix transcriptional regulator [Limnofasciculus baicalensis]